LKQFSHYNVDDDYDDGTAMKNYYPKQQQEIIGRSGVRGPAGASDANCLALSKLSHGSR